MSKITLVQILRSPEGGIRKHVVDILENISTENYEKIFITDLSTSDRDLTYLARNYGVTFYQLKIVDLPGLRDLINILKIVIYLLGKKNMILHGHGAKGGLYARVCSFFLRCKSVYTPHGGSLHRVFGKLKAFVFDNVERALIPLTDLFIFESKYSQAEFQMHVGDCSHKSIVNYNGVSFSEVPKENQYKAGNPIHLASFGLLRKLKGHDIVIDALAQLKKKGIPFSYAIYGYGEEKDNLLSQINCLELNDHVTIREFSSNILEEMKKHDVVIHPSRFESFGYVPVEAMSVKVPVITSFEGGLREVSQEPLVAKENSPHEYATIIKNIYNGKLPINEIVVAAHQKCELSFSVKTMIASLESLYSKLVQIK